MNKKEILLTDNGNLFVSGALIKLTPAESEVDSAIIINGLAFDVCDEVKGMGYFLKTRGEILLESDVVVGKDGDQFPFEMTPDFRMYTEQHVGL